MPILIDFYGSCLIIIKNKWARRLAHLYNIILDRSIRRSTDLPDEPIHNLTNELRKFIVVMYFTVINRPINVTIVTHSHTSFRGEVRRIEGVCLYPSSITIIYNYRYLLLQKRKVICY